MKIVVLHDYVARDAPPDLLDNLVQARQVARGLRELGHHTALLGFANKPDETAAELKNQKPDLVFNLVEAPMGKGRLIHMAPLLLDRMGLPYTGAGTRAMLITSNKLTAKREMLKAGLPTPPWFELGKDGAGPPYPAPGGLCLVKAVWEHGSVGMDEDSLTPGDNADELGRTVAAMAGRVGGECFAEQYIEGREFNISLLAGPAGPAVLPPAEIIFRGYAEDRPKVVGYRAKWDESSYEFSNTPRVFNFPEEDRPLLKRLKETSLACWRAFRPRGWARVDFRVDDQGRPWILEINANPCLALDAGFMAAAGRAGLSHPEVLARILGDANPGKGMNPTQGNGPGNKPGPGPGGPGKDFVIKGGGPAGATRALLTRKAG